MKKKSISVLVSCLIATSSFAQEWCMFNSNEKQFFQHSDSSYISHCISVESMSLAGGDTIFHLNRIVKQDTFYQGWPTYMANSPNFLQFDVKRSGFGIWEFTGPDTFFILPLSGLGQSWLFNPTGTLTASVGNIGLATLFGQQDSIKTINLSNGDSIVISKNFGLIWFPDLSSPGGYELVGIKGRNLGTLLPEFKDYFDFETGDVFQFHSEFWEADSWVERAREFLKLEVLSHALYTDSAVTICHRQSLWDHYELYQFPIIITNDTIRWVHYKQEEFESEAYPLSLIHGYTQVFGLWEFLTMSNIKRRPDGRVCSYFLDGYDTSFYQHALFAPVFDSMLFWVPNANPNHFTVCPMCLPNIYLYAVDKEYVTGLGRVLTNEQYFERGFWELLIGYVKQDDTTGIILPDSFFVLGIPENQRPESTLKVYPNPANLSITFDISELENPTLLVIFDVNGHLLSSTGIDRGQSSCGVKLSSFPAGLYFYEVMGEGRRLASGKFVKVGRGE